MCGICGKLNFDRDEPVDRRLLRRMMDVIQHRGPDDGGEHISGPMGLGHRRLSIIDLATGAQPMSNEDGSIWVVYNGEIYNFAELRAELVARGHQFKSTTDTEVIVHLYEEMGDRCVTRLRGMFAFALWDETQQRLLLARDRVGVKPLYFSQTSGSIVFGSELKSILEDPGVRRQIDRASIDRFLTYYYLPGGETLLHGIKKLLPGHYLTVEEGRVSVHEYWDLPQDAIPSSLGFPDAVAALQELLSRTVRDHMISDVPVGVLLSGGVDSTGILSHAVRHARQQLHTFTMGFAGRNFADERPFAQLGASTFGTHHHEMSLSAGEFRDFLPRFVWHLEEPVCEPPAVALYFVSRLAREAGVKVLLSGEGGDEAFAGYQTYRNVLLLEKVKSRLGPAQGPFALSLRALSRAGLSRFEPYAGMAASSLQDYYYSRTASPFTAFNLRKQELYTAEFQRHLSGTHSTAPTNQLFKRAQGRSVLQQMLYVDSKSWLPDDLLIKADKMTMATSVELRVPLLDFRVMEFAAALPDHYKVKGWRLKRILKAALRQSVPQDILDRKKTGFPVPYDSWMRTELRDFVRDTILSSNAAILEYFDRAIVAQIVRDHASGAGCAKEVFSLVALELWHKQFLGVDRPDLAREAARPSSPMSSGPRW